MTDLSRRDFFKIAGGAVLGACEPEESLLYRCLYHGWHCLSGNLPHCHAP